MRRSLRNGAFLVAIGAWSATALGAWTPQDRPGPPQSAAHQHPDASRLKNAVPADAASIAAGQALYQKLCVGCHGDTGKGDGALGDELNPKPADLTDGNWKHGST